MANAPTTRLLCAILLALLCGLSPVRASAPVFATADPAYASRALEEAERTELSAALNRCKEQIVACYDQGELPPYAAYRAALADALERGGAPEVAKVLRALRLQHGPPEFLAAMREVERAHQLNLYALNFKYQGAPLVFLNGGADLRDILLHESFALAYPGLKLDEVEKKVDEFLRVTAPAAYMAFLRANPDKTLPGLRAWLYGPLNATPAFAQQFWTRPGAEWARWGGGISRFAWDNAGYLTVVARNNAKGDVDQYFRQAGVPPLTERDAVTFSGYFQLQAAAFGPAKRAGLVYGLGAFLLGKDAGCRGMTVLITATPDGCALKAAIAPGNAQLEAVGEPVPLKLQTVYGLQVTYHPAPDGQCALTARVLAADGSVVGASTAACPLRAGFFADSLFLGNDPSLTDGGVLTARWYSAAVEPGAVSLFRAPLYQARARLDPNDLLQLCGAGLSGDLQVVYQRVTDYLAVPAQPPVAPPENTADHGACVIASAKSAPFSLVALAPGCLKSGQTYALWVGKPDLGWSIPVLVNDARPAWVSPSFVFAGSEVTVVGRNLDPFPADTGKTLVRLRGPETYTLTAKNDGDPATAIEAYAARVTLPADAKQGVYTIEVCRDGTNWVLLEGRALMVFPPPTGLQRFDVTQFGATPDDGTDDTAGITAAIAAAAKAPNGEVYLPAGVYNTAPFLLTRGVSLAGDGMAKTRLIFQYPDTFVHPGWGSDNTKGLISACGYQQIRDLEIVDPLGARRDQSQNTTSIGITLGEVGNDKLPPADYLTITHCRVIDASQGVRLIWSPPARHCTIFENVFQARQMGVLLGGVSELLIRHNIFLPSSAGWDYPSEVTDACQVEFSDNIAEGTVNGGWRNGFFWDLGGSVENNLVCNNRTSNDGDKGTGNGEAIAYDANGDILAYVGPCAAASPETIVLPANWGDAKKYLGAWVRVVDGKGLGQSRKIVAYTAGANNVCRLSAPWDVLPDATSALAVTRLYWQVYTVDNTIDERGNTNLKSKAGVITPYGSSSECVVDSNRQYNSEGIALYTSSVNTKNPNFTANYFTEVRRNRLEGRTSGPGAFGGIFCWYGAEDKQPSHILGYGVVITGNTVTNNDYNGQGAISLHPCWSHPTTPCCWKETLIFGNALGSVPVGVQIQEPFSWYTVLYNNTAAADVPTPLVDKGTGTVRVPAAP